MEEGHWWCSLLRRSFQFRLPSVRALHSCRCCRFKLVNGGSSTQVAHVSWQPFSSSIFVLAKFPFSFLISDKAKSFPICSVSVRISLCLSFLHCLSVYLFLPLPSFHPPALSSFSLPPALSILGFSCFGSLDDKSVSKLRSSTENRRHWCLPPPENARTLWSPVPALQKGMLSPFPFVLCCLME